jgi:hypothetical protein
MIGLLIAVALGAMLGKVLLQLPQRWNSWRSRRWAKQRIRKLDSYAPPSQVRAEWVPGVVYCRDGVAINYMPGAKAPRERQPTTRGDFIAIGVFLSGIAALFLVGLVLRLSGPH